MAKPNKLAHVVYMTRRFDEMLEWYKAVFEATAQFENPAIAFLTYDDEHHRFALVNMDVFAPDGIASSMPPGVGVNHVGYTFGNLGDLLENYDRLKKLGINPYWEVHHGMTVSVYYQDPDGNRMEFQVDCCASAEEARDFMLSDAVAANPVGVEVSFDALLEQYRNGVPAENLMARPNGPATTIPPEHGLFA